MDGSSSILILILVLSQFADAQQGWGGFCGHRLFRCFSTGSCVSTSFVCDGENDCVDWSDEPSTCPKPCGWFKFACRNGNCVDSNYVCDGDDDCGDNSDEVDETSGKCPPCLEHHHKCHDTGKCVSNEYVCDSINHCADGSDEPANCTNLLCEDRQRFQCATGDECVSVNRICDGYIDCADGSDEESPEPNNCVAKCPEGFLKCNNGQCQHHTLTCERRNDCGDWSDETEELCPCKENEYRCKKPDDAVLAGRCIPMDLVCDPEGIWDCILGDDEANCSHNETLPQ